MSSEAVLRTDFSRGEATGGIIWLSIGALFSLFVEMLYVGTWIDVPGLGMVPFPWTILLAFFFNMVLTKTASLWSQNTWVRATPVIVWAVGFFAAVALAEVLGLQLLANNIRTIALLVTGIIGGVWPLLRTR
ncbi:hypothetical protein [Corynebacterium yudongzhengii]|uniref:hypothetical protein n=1 Tax=Corynebacterium yudongzhengii TaxID=2080740 RepID=UPI001F1B6028|nr:hypothetical protein [Corynebacterium yudongzhengii]